MRLALRSLLLACSLSLAVAATLAAQQIQYVEIVVKDIDSGEDIGTVEPGGSVEITGTANVRLIMTAVARNGKTIYPYTTYSIEDGGGRITRSNPQNGAADVNLAQASGEEQWIYFSIDDDRVPEDLTEGSFAVSVGN